MKVFFRLPSLLFLITLGLFTTNVTGQVVINEVYGGGGNSGAIYNQDFVELYNPTSSAVTLTNHSVQYQSQGGTTWSVAASGTWTVPANGYFLIGLATGANGIALPTPDATGGTNLSATAGKVVLVAQTTALSSGCPTTYIDLVGYGTTSVVCNEGSVNAASPSDNTKSNQRTPEGFDSNINGDDFTIAAPSPRNSGMTPPTITDITDQTIPVSSNTGALAFTVGDGQTAVGSLLVSATSDNTALVPNANIVFGGSGTNRDVTVTPNSGQSGVVTITVTVTDTDGQTATDTFVVIVGTVPTCNAGSEVSITPGGTGTSGGITVYASTQANTPALADTTDDAWESGLTAVSLNPSIATGLSATGSRDAIQIISSVGFSYTVSTREMASSVNSPPCQGSNISIGRTINSNAAALQDVAPRPTTAVLSATVQSYSENLGGLSANSGKRNALLFEFSSNLRAFGAWFGDVEGRTDSTTAMVRLFDAAGNRIGNDFIIAETNAPYANKQTRWIGFISDSFNVKSMLVIVGDDDSISFTDFLTNKQSRINSLLAPLNGQGFSEHLSFIGGKSAFAPTAASGSIVGRALTAGGRGILNATITLNDSVTGEIRIARTNSFGYYRFDDVAIGNFYIISANKKGYTFANNTQSLQLFSDSEQINFIANP